MCQQFSVSPSKLHSGLSLVRLAAGLVLTAVVSLITPSWLLLSVLQDCFTVEGEDLKHDFERLQLAMEMVGFLPATRRQWVKHTQMQRVCDDIRCWKKCKIPERLLQLRLHHHHHVVNLSSKLYSNQIFIKTKEPTDWDSLQLHFHSIFLCVVNASWPVV